jgi:hypothetical protein
MAPYDNLIKVNKDRNFGISGELKTGNFRFRGKDLSFNYGEFSVKLNKIDSITFVPQKELAKRGRTEVGGDLKYESGQFISTNLTTNLVVKDWLNILDWWFLLALPPISTMPIAGKWRITKRCILKYQALILIV